MKQARKGKHILDGDAATTHGSGDDKVVVAGDDDSDRPAWAQGNNESNPHSKGGGQPADAGDMKGDLYGDLYVILRDLDANGVPVLDENGNEILLAEDGTQIFKTVDGDIPEDQLDLVQEVEFSRLSVARAPDTVIEHALEEAWTKIGDLSTVTYDPAGRIVIADGTTIDSPLENLALYQDLMEEGQGGDAESVDLDLTASLFGAAADKTITITVDMVVYENSILGLNEPEYFDFSTYDYSRLEKYDPDVQVTWFDPNTIEIYTDYLINAVFGDEPRPADGEDLTTTYPTTLEWSDPTASAGLDDFVQAADDTRAVIDFLHDASIIEIVDDGSLLA